MSRGSASWVALRFASRQTAGDVMLYDQDNPANNEVLQPGNDAYYRLDEEKATTPGDQPPSRQLRDSPPGSSRVIPDAMTQTLEDNYIVAGRRPGVSKWVVQAKVYDNIRDIEHGSAKVVRAVGNEWLVSYRTSAGDQREALVGGHETGAGQVYLSVRRKTSAKKVASARIEGILGNCGPEIQQRSKGIQFRRTRILPEKGMITYDVRGSSGDTYKVRIKGVRKDKRVKALAKMPVRISCSCPYFRWQGPEHWAKANGYLYGRPVGTASRPTTKDPKGQHWACKHVYAVLEDRKNMRFASGEWRFSGPCVPDYSG